MCAIVGALLNPDLSRSGILAVNDKLNHIFESSLERGRDGRGWASFEDSSLQMRSTLDEAHSVERNDVWGEPVRFFNSAGYPRWLIGNLRAEPTTEYVREKHPSDQQPYSLGGWHVVHNGTIANDKQLRNPPTMMTTIDSAAIVEVLARFDEPGCTLERRRALFADAISNLEGSYAILATHDAHPDTMFVAVNYRPVWYAVTRDGVFFASARDYFPGEMVPQMVKPYTVATFNHHGLNTSDTCFDFEGDRSKALVVCSGGLDSVVAAAWAQNAGYDVSLIHFQYGSRAQGPEVRAVEAVASALGVPYQLFPLPIYQPEDSPLLRADSAIAGGEAGAEFAHEWVPARNLVMLSVATAMAEAHGFGTIILGNNLEEAGAYPDNEPEFINRFNDLLPFAVGDGKRVRVLMPVGNMMKHEIVALGHQLKAPMDKTWSCYRAGEEHCGTCGPCFMRRTAFKINGLPEVISYLDERTNS